MSWLIFPLFSEFKSRSPTFSDDSGKHSGESSQENFSQSVFTASVQLRRKPGESLGIVLTQGNRLINNLVHLPEHFKAAQKCFLALSMPMLTVLCVYLYRRPYPVSNKDSEVSLGCSNVSEYTRGYFWREINGEALTSFKKETSSQRINYFQPTRKKNEKKRQI